MEESLSLNTKHLYRNFYFCVSRDITTQLNEINMFVFMFRYLLFVRYILNTNKIVHINEMVRYDN